MKGESKFDSILCRLRVSPILYRKNINIFLIYFLKISTSFAPNVQISCLQNFSKTFFLFFLPSNHFFMHSSSYSNVTLKPITYLPTLLDFPVDYWILTISPGLLDFARNLLDFSNSKKSLHFGIFSIKIPKM